MTTTNGQAKPSMPATLKEAREQRRLLQEQLTVLRLTREKKLLDSFWGGWGFDRFGGSDFWERVRLRTDDDCRGWLAVPPPVPSDYRPAQRRPVGRRHVHEH